MRTDPVSEAFYYGQVFAPLVIFSVCTIGLIMGLRMFRWYTIAGAWIVIGNGIILGLILMNYMTSFMHLNNEPRRTVPRFVFDTATFIDVINLASIFVISAGLLCQLYGIGLLAKRCRELQHQN